jgi:hypothetical protein
MDLCPAAQLEPRAGEDPGMDGRQRGLPGVRGGAGSDTSAAVDRRRRRQRRPPQWQRPRRRLWPRLRLWPRSRPRPLPWLLPRIDAGLRVSLQPAAESATAMCRGWQLGLVVPAPTRPVGPVKPGRAPVLPCCQAPRLPGSRAPRLRGSQAPLPPGSLTPASPLSDGRCR